MRLDTIELGTRFRVPSTGREGRLLYLSDGSATVEYTSASRTFTTWDGKEVTISAGSERVTISRGTEVEAV